VGVSLQQEEGSFARALARRSRFGIKPGLERTRRVLAELGDPQVGLDFVHVAGTNGKGSVCAMIAQVLQESGARVGLYTSPHLAHWRERIQIDGVPIAANAVEELGGAVLRAAEVADASGDPVTEFELGTALACLYFARGQVDIVVWETGLGGTYDATNVVDPLLSVITNVDLDHTQILGSTVEQIARDKAGIVKPGRPVVTGCSAAAWRIVAERAMACGSSLVTLGRDCRVVREPGTRLDDRVHYFGIRRDWHGLRCGLRGPYQAQNAGVALAALEVIADARPEWRMEQAAVRRGLTRVRWPGRCEWINPQVAAEQAGVAPVILDGAHNPAGAAALVRALREAGAERAIVVFGAMADKDIGGMLRAFRPVCAEMIAVAADTPRAAAAAAVIGEWQRWAPQTPGHVASTVAAGVARALELQRGSGMPICIAGSLSVVAEARQALGQDDGIGLGESGECRK